MDPHKHQCPSKACKHVWEHSLPDGCTSQEHDEAHHCPQCGAEQYEKHYANKAEREAAFQKWKRRMDHCEMENLPFRRGPDPFAAMLMEFLRGDPGSCSDERLKRRGEKQ